MGGEEEVLPTMDIIPMMFLEWRRRRKRKRITRKEREKERKRRKGKKAAYIKNGL